MIIHNYGSSSFFIYDPSTTSPPGPAPWPTTWRARRDASAAPAPAPLWWPAPPDIQWKSAENRGKILGNPYGTSENPCFLLSGRSPRLRDFFLFRSIVFDYLGIHGCKLLMLMCAYIGKTKHLLDLLVHMSNKNIWDVTMWPSKHGDLVNDVLLSWFGTPFTCSCCW